MISALDQAEADRAYAIWIAGDRRPEPQAMADELNSCRPHGVSKLTPGDAVLIGLAEWRRRRAEAGWS
ncbi:MULTISPECIES: hypothetical protein [unclassified Aureimonas]|uniref:hypothetical protein n=1 Tax=unclassified Aureimonas TaxID=2615206 RepID=UPI0006F6CFF4|nr:MULTISPECIES: hypothetical protein [unclassified Aureimonas]KQT52252.1 hypothetical protein ASG62_16480 [Aureimonas sp. Leaf427]KQT65744.1 hypothetical protein ASG54_22580 [Aureimonas sp. Leaf460]